MKLIFSFVVLGLFSYSLVWACLADGQTQMPKETPTPEQILQKIQEKSQQTTSVKAEIDYLVIQDPDLTNTRLLRKGHLFYLKTDNQAWAKIVFETFQQDDFEPQTRREVYVFDGVWLTKIDYTLKQAEQIQQAPDDKPIEPFTFLSRYFPLIGLPGCQDVQTDFDVQLMDRTVNNGCWLLKLKVKPDSQWAKDYLAADFYIDQQSLLPRRVEALTTQNDKYQLEFNQIQINKAIDRKVFKAIIPDDFQVKKQPLMTETSQHANPEKKG